MAANEPSELELTAYHEAGHAVACFELGRGFKHVTIVPTPEFAGRVTLTRWTLRWDETNRASPRVRDYLENDILVDLAGPIAEEKRLGMYNENGAYYDNTDAVDAALYLVGGDPRSAELYLDWLNYRAKQLLCLPWTWISVQALAEELLKTPTIATKRAKNIIREAMNAATSRRAKAGKWIDHFGEEMPDWSMKNEDTEQQAENGVTIG